jgi:hypothetical protein
MSNSRKRRREKQGTEDRDTISGRKLVSRCDEKKRYTSGFRKPRASSISYLLSKWAWWDVASHHSPLWKFGL